MVGNESKKIRLVAAEFRVRRFHKLKEEEERRRIYIETFKKKEKVK